MDCFNSEKRQYLLCSKNVERSKTEYVFDYLFITSENRCPFCMEFKTPGEICGKCIKVVQARCMLTFTKFGLFSVPQCGICEAEKDHPVCMICLTEFKKPDTKDPLILSLREKNHQGKKMWSRRAEIAERFSKMECD